MHSTRQVLVGSSLSFLLMQILVSDDTGGLATLKGGQSPAEHFKMLILFVYSLNCLAFVLFGPIIVD